MKLVPSGRILGATVEDLDDPGSDDPVRHRARRKADRRDRVLEGMTVLHDFNKFWEMMQREKGSKRPALAEAQRRAKPPVSHPIFLVHPITGKRVEHQLKPAYRYRHEWTKGDLLMWENFGTIHNALADSGSDEHRLIKRCQVMATRFFQAA